MTTITSVIEDDELKFRDLQIVKEKFSGDILESLLPAKETLMSLDYLINDVYTDIIKPINSYNEYSHIFTDFDFMTLPRVFAVLKSLANEPSLWLGAIGKMGMYSLTVLCSIIIKDVGSLKGEGYITSNSELEEYYPGVIEFLEHDYVYLEYLILAHNIKMYRTFIVGLTGFYDVSVEQLPDNMEGEMDRLFEDVLSKYILSPIELEYTTLLYNDEDRLSLVHELVNTGLIYVLPNGTLMTTLDEESLSLEKFEYDIDTWLAMLIRASGTVPVEEDGELLDDVGFENSLLEDRVIEHPMDDLKPASDSWLREESSLELILGVKLGFLRKNKHILHTMKGRYKVFGVTDDELYEKITNVTTTNNGAKLFLAYLLSIISKG